MTEKEKAIVVLTMFKKLLPEPKGLTEKDLIYIYGRLDSLKNMIVLFTDNNEGLLKQWQELADKYSYRAYIYTQKTRKTA